MTGNNFNQSQPLILYSDQSESQKIVLKIIDRVYSSDDGGEIFVWDKRKIDDKDSIKEDILLRRGDYGEERGAIDCIKIVGSKLFLSYDDFGKIAIQDFW